MTAPIPSGFKSREEYNAYMRKYRAENPDKARDYREDLKRTFREKFKLGCIEKRDQFINDSLKDLEIDLLHGLFQQLLTYQVETVVDFRLDIQKSLEIVSKKLEEMRQYIETYFDQSMAKLLFKSDEQFDKTFDRVLEEALNKFPQTQVEQRLEILMNEAKKTTETDMKRVEAEIKAKLPFNIGVV